MVRVLFLGGLGRSGTTLLERILGELPGVCPLGEVVHLWERDLGHDERCACGTRFSGCDFWQAVGAKAFGSWSAVNVPRVLELRSLVERTRQIPVLAAPVWSARRRELVAEYTRYYTRIYQAAAELSGASVVVDSSKHAALAYCLRRAAELDLRVVHVVRDSRGVAYSWTKRVSRPEAEPGSEMTRYPPGRSALLWNAHNAAFGLLARCGVPVRRIRYEELLANPRGTAWALAEFAGLAESKVDLSFLGHYADGTRYADLGPCHSAAGNPMRFVLGRVPLRRDDDWRSALTPANRRLVAALTAPLLAAYRYPVA